MRSLSWDSDSEAASEAISSEADTEDESPSRTVLSQHSPPFAPDYFMGEWGYNREEHQDMSPNAPPLTSAEIVLVASTGSQRVTGNLRNQILTRFGFWAQFLVDIRNLARLLTEF